MVENGHANMQQKYLQVLKEFAMMVRSVYPDAHLLAFGSHVRRMATEESDLDVCVVLKSLTPEDRLAVSDMAWEIGFDHDILISTVVISQEDFQGDSLMASPLVDAIKSEGVAA
jgi:uncharacterized protein